MSIKLSTKEICNNLENLKKLYPKQHKLVYILGKRMRIHLAKIHKIDAGYFIAAAIMSIKDLHNKRKTNVRNKKLLGFVPFIADKTCPKELSERVKRVYKVVSQDLSLIATLKGEIK